MILRKLALFGVLVAMAVIGVAGPASADGTRTITGSTTCTSGIVPFGFSVNLGAGWVGADSSYQIPGTQTKVWTATIPASATRIALDSFCYTDWYEYDHGGYPYGTWIGNWYDLTAGTSTVSSTWICTRHTVYPGPWVRICDRTAISYG